MTSGSGTLSLLALGLLHAAVDATTVTVVFRATRVNDLSLQVAFGIVLAYDVIAFGSQLLLGWLTDRLATPKLALVLGLVLSGVSVFAFAHQAVLAMLLAAVGNALFHLGAGANVLSRGLDRAWRSGVFVAPGALGLGFGIFYGKNPALGPAWPLSILLLASALAVMLWLAAERAPRFTKPKLEIPKRAGQAALVLLLVSVAIRSLVGLSAARGLPRSEYLLFGLPLAAFLGKSLGGWLADRWGWAETCVVALLCSAPLIGLGQMKTGFLLVGLLLFQMTMPVTLIAVARIMPGRLATALGWTCLALAIGSLPTMFHAGEPLSTRPLLVLWILLAALALFHGMRLLGFNAFSKSGKQGVLGNHPGELLP